MKTKTSINIDKDLWDRAGLVAEAQDRSRSYIIEHIIEAGLSATENTDDFTEALRRFGEDFRKVCAAVKKKHDELKAEANGIKSKSIHPKRNPDHQK